MRHTLTLPARLVLFSAAGWAAIVCLLSFLRWSTFQYRSFDLAFYIQGLWQFLHGRFDVSLLNVPLLGNHAEPIVFLLAPIFALVPHPMTLVVLQNVALAMMAPVGYRLCRHFELPPNASALLALATLLAPATGFVALHEFHPEALSAPILLLLIDARLRRKFAAFWIWFLLALACKENIALLLVAFCVVRGWLDRRAGVRAIITWNGLPALAALGWLILYGRVLSPWLNHGNVEYIALYSHLGNSGGTVLASLLSPPFKGWHAIFEALTHGNLLWAVLLPFAGLALLRPLWLVIAAPVLFQHLLSWRSSEWQIYFHYAAPLIPLLWIGTVEAIVLIRSWRVAWAGVLPSAVVALCLGAQCWIGPAVQAVETVRTLPERRQASLVPRYLLSQISPDASVTAPLPYLSHLAKREQLVSLHHILKGLKTLSREVYVPPRPTDVVFVDYDDDVTFDATAGYYHPRMRSITGQTFPSSDQLLNRYLSGQSWSVTSLNAITLFTKAEARPTGRGPQAALASFPGATLTEMTVTKALALAEELTVLMRWNLAPNREVFPWLVLELKNATTARRFEKGLCAPEVAQGTATETWQIHPLPDLPEGEYEMRAVFYDHPQRLWQRPDAHLATLPLGHLTVRQR